MILEVIDSFSIEAKAKLDGKNPIIQEWEDLMWKYQQKLPTAIAGDN